MMGVPAGVRIWLVAGVTDMRKGMDSLCALVQTALEESPFGGHLYVFRGRRGDKVKVLWHEADGLSLYCKRLDRGRFVWPQAANGAVLLTNAQLSMLLEGIDWVRRETDARQRVEVPREEGLANHLGPESCGGVREGAVEALTGVHVGRANERRKTSSFGVLMVSSRQKAIWHAAYSRAAADSASSVEPGMRARLAHGNREISASPPPAGWWAAW
jgi:transposase